MSRQKILSLLIAIIPVAYIYSFPLLINNLGNAIMLFLVFPMLLKDYFSLNQTNSNKTTKYYLAFSTYVILVSVFSPGVYGFEGNIRELFSAIEFSVILYFLVANRRLSQTFIDIYTQIAVVFSCFLILQYAFFILFGIPVSGVIPFLSLYNRDVKSVIEGRLIRLCSVFAEPSHFSVYVIPALVMYLFNKTSQRRRLTKLSIISISILLSTSSNGIISMGIVYGAFLVRKYFRKINPVYYAFGGMIFISTVYLVTSSKYINDVTYGLFTEEEGMTTSKAELRIYRGFNMYFDMPVGVNVVGIGWRNAENYCKNQNSFLYVKYRVAVFDYFNSIAGSLIYFGIIGLILLLLFFYSMYKSTTDFGTKTLIVCVLALMFSSSVLMSDQWVFFLASIIAMINREKDRTIKLQYERR